jgi:hypothetical protein
VPQVPRYDNFQTSISSRPQVSVQGGGLQAPGGPTAGGIAGEQASQFGAAAMRTGDAVSKIAQDAANEANQARVDDATNQLIKARTGLQMEALSFTGRAALERPDNKSLIDEYGEKLGAAAKDIAGTLGNSAQQTAFTHQAAQLGHQLSSTLGSHMLQQQKQFQADTWKDTADQAAKQAGLLWGDAAILDQSRGAIQGVLAKVVSTNGWDATKDKALIDSTRDKLMGPMHTAVIQGMLGAGKATEAKAYYDANSTDMSLQARATLHDHIQAVDVLVRGDNAADSAWETFAPKGPNDPVRIYDMEQALRTQFKGDPKLRDAAIASIKQRAAGFNAQQAEVNAGSINSIYGMIDKGMPLRQVQSSPEWLALPEVKRHEITKGLESEAATRAARGASDASRQLSQLQRDDKLALLNNGASYLTASDPDTLRQMSRAQVEALRTTFGLEGTQHLLAKHEQVSKSSDKVIEARIDKQDFEQVADSLGLKPYAKDSSEDHKRSLGTLQFRVEQMINAEQVQKKRVLTREEKTDLMTREMSKKVAVSGWFSNSDVPVIQLNAEQAGKVQIPAAEKAKVSDALRAMYQQNPNNPAYAPTEANMRRLFLQNKSRAASLIPDAK